MAFSLKGPRLDFRRSLVSGLPHSGEERGLVSRTAAGNRAYKGPHRELLGYLSGQAPEPQNIPTSTLFLFI